MTHSCFRGNHCQKGTLTQCHSWGTTVRHNPHPSHDYLCSAPRRGTVVSAARDVRSTLTWASQMDSSSASKWEKRMALRSACPLATSLVKLTAPMTSHTRDVAPHQGSIRYDLCAQSLAGSPQGTRKCSQCPSRCKMRPARQHRHCSSNSECRRHSDGATERRSAL